MAKVSVAPVEGRRDLLRFIRFPLTIYPPESPWVAPLEWERLRFFNRKKNPFFRFARMELFLARDDRGRELGRIAAILNPRHNEYQKKEIGFFGFFDSVDDPEVAAALFGAAEGWLREKGFRTFQGPFNPSSNYECGLLVSGFDRPPRIMMTYNHPYYAGLVEGAGYGKAMDLVAYEYETERGNPERLRRGVELILKRGGISMRKANLRRFDEELERLKTVYHEAWSANYGFVPFSDAELDRMAKEFRPFITPDLCQFAEVNGELAGMMLILPDLNQALKPLRGRLFPLGWWKLLRGLRRIDTIRAILMGARPAYRNLGLDHLFYYEGLKVGETGGFRNIELSWILETNVGILRPLNRLGGREGKRYRLYEKTVE